MRKLHSTPNRAISDPIEQSEIQPSPVAHVQIMKQHHGLRPELKNAAWLIADHSIRLITGLFVGAWLARYLGPAEYGELSYILAIAAFFQVTASLGLDGVVVRELSGDQYAAPLVLGTAFRGKAIAAGGAWLLACAATVALRPGDGRALLLMAIVAGGILVQPVDVIDLWFQSRSQSFRTVLSRLAAHLLANGAKIALIMSDANLVSFAVLVAAESFVSALFLALVYRTDTLGEPWRYSRSTLRGLLRDGLPLMVSSLMIVSYTKVDQIMLRQLAGETELGIYSAALPFSTAWLFLPTTICISALPTLTKLHGIDQTRFLARLQQLFGVLAWMGVGIFLILHFLADHLVRVLLGEAYGASANILVIHALGNIFSFLVTAQGQLILIERRSTFALTRNLLGAVSNIAGNFLLIPRFGAMGAAIASVAGQATAALALNLLLDRRIFFMQLRALLPTSMFPASNFKSTRAIERP